MKNYNSGVFSRSAINVLVKYENNVQHENIYLLLLYKAKCTFLSKQHINLP